MSNTPNIAERSSTAHIKVPGAQDTACTVAASSNSASFHDELKELLWACGPDANRHHLATIGIKACIGEGIDTLSQLIAVLAGQGFDRGHVANILKYGTGSNPATHEWSKAANGHYSLLS